MFVRPAATGDISAIQDVDRALERDIADPDIFRAAIAGGHVVVAVEAEEIVGYVRWQWYWDSIPYCRLARVKPSHHRQGVGRALYEHVEAALRKVGATFWLSSTEEQNERSLRFHRALGFRPIGALSELGQDPREIFMRKDLS